jgi:hypothetical protein
MFPVPETGPGSFASAWVVVWAWTDVIAGVAANPMLRISRDSRKDGEVRVCLKLLLLKDVRVFVFECHLPK